MSNKRWCYFVTFVASATVPTAALLLICLVGVYLRIANKDILFVAYLSIVAIFGFCVHEFPIGVLALVFQTALCTHARARVIMHSNPIGDYRSSCVIALLEGLVFLTRPVWSDLKWSLYVDASSGEVTVYWGSSYNSRIVLHTTSGPRIPHAG